MRRVLLVYDPPAGGVAEHVRRLALGLAQHGWQPTVVGPEESMIYEEIEGAGIALERIGFKPNYTHPIADIRALRALRRVLRGGSFDVVHAHNSKAGAIARAPAFPDMRVVYSPHCFPFVAPFSRARVALATAIERACVRRTAMVVCAAEEERRQALDRKIVERARTRVIYYGTPPCEGAADPDAELERFRDGRPLAATLCALREQKAVHVFLDAVPEILERCPEAVTAVIGDGPLRADLEARARALGLGDRFAFFAFRPPPARQLASIDVFVLTSGWEALPIAVLEAMACGVPQVASAVNGTPEALLDGVTGLLAPPGDSAAFAERVSRLLGDEEARRRMSEASVARHRAEFGVERMVAQTAALYDELAAA